MRAGRSKRWSGSATDSSTSDDSCALELRVPPPLLSKLQNFPFKQRQGALHSITGFDILADQDLWTTRIAEENQWALESWPAEREALADAAAPDAQLAAIARIAERRMHAAHIVPILAPLVRDGTPDVRLAAARVLGAFGRPSSIPVLADVVLDSEVRVAAAASESLARITGLTAPARAGDWLDELAL